MSQKPLLKVYTYKDGINDEPFPYKDNQLEIEEYTFTEKRMGNVTLSASVLFEECLDDLWVTGLQYVDFRGERYFIVKTPSSSKTNTDARYKHDIEFLPQRNVLDNIYFYDVVSGDTERYVSNSTTVLFNGDIQEFVTRLNASLHNSGVEYRVVIDDGISSDAKLVSIENMFISEVLQEIFNIYELPFYFSGTTIHVGFTDNSITHTFKYGADFELLSVSKTNANYKITNRVTGTGSTDNIPFYYPNPSNDRKTIEESGGRWITPSQNLMPPVYRETFGEERFYNARNNTFINKDTGEYYEFENEYTQGSAKEQITDFPDIKPSIVNTLNSAGKRIDQILGVAFDENDSDEIDEETGEYLHPYFYIKLPKFDGEYGFNLFKHAIVGSDATITMTSGTCSPCNFVLGVVEVANNGEQEFRNPVQVDADGNIVSGDFSDKVNENNFIQSQQDTMTSSVWIAVKKDISTFGIVMPNDAGNIYPRIGDTFVIINISMPQTYIHKAENDLKEAIIKYMADNNKEKFTFSLKLSRIFLANNTSIEKQLNSNSRIDLEYNGKFHQLYISSYSYKSDKEILPEITIQLDENLTVSKNSMQLAIDSVKQDIMNSIGSVDFLKQGLKHFLRKDANDYAREFITFLKGLKIGQYVPGGNLGGIFAIDENGKTYIETDMLKVRMKAYFETLEIVNVNSVSGKQVITPGGSFRCIKVKDREVTVDKDGNIKSEQIWDYFRCYFLAEQDGIRIENRFKINDQAQSQDFNIKEGVSNGASNHYYWRLVVGVGDDYIDLSKTDKDTGSDEPAEGDVICQIGNREDTSRQNAIIFSSVDSFSPNITLYNGINSYSYLNKDVISYGVDQTTGKAFHRVYGDSYVGNREQTSYIKFVEGDGVKIKGKLETGTIIGDNSTIEEALEKATRSAVTEASKELTNYAAEVAGSLDDLQMQIDGAIFSFFEEYDPTISNYPANEWTTEAIKKQHGNDTFTNTSTGASWRWINKNNIWTWEPIADTATQQALVLAGLAKDTADGKRRVFVEQPKNSDAYDIGDLWVNAIYENIYTNDILRCKTSKIAHVAFDIKHWEKASKYTDDTAAKEAKEEALSAADAAADAATAAAVAAASVNTLNEYVDGAFRDGVVTDTEKQVIKSYLNTIDSTSKGVTATYYKLYANAYLSGDPKTELKTAYDKLGDAIKSLISSVNTAIAPNSTKESFADVNVKFDEFNVAIGKFNEAVETANLSIQNKLKTFSDAAQNAADAAALAAGNAQNAANAASKQVSDLNLYIDGAFADGIITATEAQSISTYINTVNNTKHAITATYENLYTNIFLEGVPKNELKDAYEKISDDISSLILSIQEAISDGVTSDTEIANVNANFELFNASYGKFTEAVEVANKAIQDKLKSYSDTAQDAADKANDVAAAAKQRLDSWAEDGVISPTEKQGLKDEIQRIDADKEQIEEGYNLYGLGSAIGYNTAYKAYREQLVALSATTPEIISIPETFAKQQTTYYLKRTEALGTIAGATKSVADNAKAVADAAKQRLDSWAEDGVISPTEKQGLKDEIQRIDADKDEIVSAYTTYNLGNPEAYNTAYKAYREQLVALSATTPEIISIPETFAKQQTTYYSERTKAIKAINTASKGAAESARLLALEAKGAANEAIAAADEVAGTVANLDIYIKDAFRDGIIDETEKSSIAKYLNTIDSTIQGVTATYEKLQSNVFLDSTSKTGLETEYKKFTLNTTNLIDAINAAVGSEKITTDIVSNVNANFELFNASYGKFTEAVEVANKAIQDKLKSYSDTAQDAADNAKAVADAAKQRLDSWAEDGVISPTEKQGLKDEIQRIDADKEQIIQGYTLYGLGEPTAYNTAYTTYRDILNDIVTSISEVVDIPDSFSKDQTTYYTQRTMALSAISSASKTLIDAANAAAQEAKDQIKEVKTDLSSLNNTVTSLRDLTDTAFADGIIDKIEYSTISGYIHTIDSILSDVKASYSVVSTNSLLTDATKLSLTNAYNSFSKAGEELLKKIKDLIEGEEEIESIDRAAVNSLYDLFNEKYSAFSTALNNANKEITDLINDKTDQLVKELSIYEPVKEALLEKTTTEGGLILTSLISLGYTQKDTSKYITKSGISGIYDSSKKGGGIAAWYGGSPIDRFDTENPIPDNVASGVIRMDGTGYFANGNFWWETDGKIHVAPDSFLIDKEDVGKYLLLFDIKEKEDGKIDYAIPQAPFQNLTISNYLRIGNGMLKWDEKNNAIYVVNENGNDANFYTTGGLSAMGMSIGQGGGGGIGATALYQLLDVMPNEENTGVYGAANGYVLSYNSTAGKWHATPGLDEASLGTYLSTNKYTTQSWVTNYAPSKGGAGASGIWGISITGNAVTATTAGKVAGTLTFAAGAFAAKTYNGAETVTVNVPTHTSHLTNDSAYATQAWTTSGFLAKKIITLRESIKDANNWSLLDSYNKMENCGYYLINAYPDTNVAATNPVFMYGDDMGHGMYQVVMGNFGTTDGVITGHYDSKMTILYREYHLGSGGSSTVPPRSWGKWKDYLDGYATQAWVSSTFPTKAGSGASGTWGISISGNATTADRLMTGRKIWGQSFNGSTDISGALTGVTNITASATISAKDVMGTSLIASTYIQIGQIRLHYDSENNAIKVVKSDGTAANLYATGGLSSMGISTGQGGEGTGGLIDTVYSSSDLGGEFSDTSLNDTFNAYTINKIAGRVSSLESGNALTIITVGTGNVVTSVTKSGGTITVSKNLIAATQAWSDSRYPILDSDKKIPSSYLPSYVDDVLEYSNKTAFPTTGESGKIYVDKATNLTYRWSGSAYVEISPSIALGETSSTAYAGDKGKANAAAIASLTTTVNNLKTGSGASGTWGISITGNATTATTANKVAGTLTFAAGTFSTKTFNGSAATTVNIPTHTSHLTNNSGFLTAHQSLAAYATQVWTKDLVYPNSTVRFDGIVEKAEILAMSVMSKGKVIYVKSAKTFALKADGGDAYYNNWVGEEQYITWTDDGTIAYKDKLYLLDDTLYSFNGTDLIPYATQEWVNSQGFLKTHQSLAGYATTSWASATFPTKAGSGASGTWGISITGNATTATTATTANKVAGTLTFAAGAFAAKTYNGSAAVTVNVPTHTSHLTNNSGFLTSDSSLAWAKLTGKPTTLAGYGITDGVNAVSVTGSGNAVTSASVSGHTLTLTKGATFLTSHQSLAAYATQAWVNAKGYLVATATDKANWNNAYSWGDHAYAGYATADYVNPYLTARFDGFVESATMELQSLIVKAPIYYVKSLKRFAAFYQGKYYNNWVDANLYRPNLDAPYTTKIYMYGDHTYYFNGTDFVEYATQSWVNSQGFLKTHQSLTGYATTSWVSANFPTKTGAGASGSWAISITGNAATATTATTANKVAGTLSFAAGAFAVKTYNGSAAVTVNVPTKTSHLTNDSGYLTAASSLAWAKLTGKPTTIAGYGITDAKIANGVITLGANTITPLTSHQSLAGYATLGTDQTITGQKTFSKNVTAPQFISNIGTGTAPFAVSSTTVVSNLNADLLDGYHGSSSSTASTYVLRNSSRYVYLSYINSDTGRNENHVIDQFIGTNSSDNFYRKFGRDYVRALLNDYSVNKKTLDLTDLDENTYYPCHITLSPAVSTRINIFVNINSGSKPSWATHASGFALNVSWEAFGSGWGGSRVQRKIFNSEYYFTSANPCGGIRQNIMASHEIVYLRGGGKYYYVVNNTVANIVINKDGYKWVSGDYNFSAPAIPVSTPYADPAKCYEAGSMIGVSSLYALNGYIENSLSVSGNITASASTVTAKTFVGALTGNATTATTASKVANTLTFAAGTFAAKTFNGSAATTVNVPTHTSHLTNNSGFITNSALTGYATQAWTTSGFLAKKIIALRDTTSKANDWSLLDSYNKMENCGYYLINAYPDTNVAATNPVFMYGDDMGHGMYQVVMGNFGTTDGVITGHYDSKMTILYREYHLGSGGSSTVPPRSWGKWKDYLDGYATQAWVESKKYLTAHQSLAGYATQSWVTASFPTKTGTGASGLWGISISGNAATATKLGTATVGSATKPIYLNGGTATACGASLAVSVTGNAATATALATGRTINGTSFNGSANIVTSYWGTARTIKIGSQSISINGSSNVTFSRNSMATALGREAAYTGMTVANTWYRIASSSESIYNLNGTFYITLAASGYHSSYVISAGTSYGQNAFVQQLAGTNFSNSIFTDVRIVTANSYSGNYAYLEIYVTRAISTTFTIRMVGDSEWSLLTSMTAGSIPSGYYSKAISLYGDSIVATNFRGNASTATKLKVNDTFDPTAQAVNSSNAGTFCVYDSYNVSGTPTTYGDVIEINSSRASHWKPQLWFDSGANGSLRHRNRDYNTTAWGAWHTLVDSNNYTTIVKKIGTANVGSSALPIYLNAGTPTQCASTLGVSITGNAASATKLATARTLWGQSFNGTANISGDMTGVGRLQAQSRFNEYLATYNGTINAKGTICITLPNGFTNAMNIYEIYLYEYINGIAASVITVAGYNYSSPAWINIGYHTKGSYDKKVRLGYNGSKCVIMLGETTTVWQYPQVFLKSVYNGFNNITGWNGVYSISLITSETGYTSIAAPPKENEYFGNVYASSFNGDLKGNADTATTATTANKVAGTLTFAAGAFAGKTFNGSAAVTVNVPTHTSHLTNNSGFLTSASSLAWAKLTGKPTTLAGYGVTDGVNAVSVTGSGNAITSASVSGHTLTLTKGATFLTSHQSLAAYATQAWVNAKGYLVATATDKANWNNAYSWGDHAYAGYATADYVNPYLTARFDGFVESATMELQSLIVKAPIYYVKSLKRFAAFYQGKYYNNWVDANLYRPNLDAPYTTKIYMYGDHTYYFNGTDFVEYATQAWVNSQGFLKTHQSLAGYATTTWANNTFPTKAGSGASGTWGISITGNAKTATTATTATTANKVAGTLTFAAGAFAAKTYNGSAAVTVNVPTHTSHLVNNSGFLTAHQSLAAYATTSYVSSNYLKLTGGTASGQISVKASTGKVASLQEAAVTISTLSDTAEDSRNKGMTTWSHVDGYCNFSSNLRKYRFQMGMVYTPDGLQTPIILGSTDSNNNIYITCKNAAININKDALTGYTLPTVWNWYKGTTNSYADFNLGNISLTGTLNVEDGMEAYGIVNVFDEFNSYTYAYFYGETEFQNTTSFYQKVYAADIEMTARSTVTTGNVINGSNVNNQGFFTLGKDSAQHLSLDSSKIQSYSNTSFSALYVNYYGGAIYIGNPNYITTIRSKTTIATNAATGASLQIGLSKLIYTNSTTVELKSTSGAYMDIIAKNTSASSSDARLKTSRNYNVDYCERLMSLGRVFDYKYNDLAKRINAPGYDELTHTGLLYQDVAGVMPHITKTFYKDYGAIDYRNPDFINLLVGSTQMNILAIRDLVKRSNSIEEEIEMLKEENRDLRSRVQALERV